MAKLDSQIELFIRLNNGEEILFDDFRKSVLDACIRLNDAAADLNLLLPAITIRPVSIAFENIDAYIEPRLRVRLKSND